VYAQNGGAVSVAIQPDGKTLALSGTDSGSVLLVRFTASGQLDSTFGTGGMSIHFGSPDNFIASAMLLQPDGRILVAGAVISSSIERMFVSRFLTNGDVDVAFGSGGLVTTDFPGLSAGAAALALGADGKIVIAGTAGAFGSLDFAAARFASNGALDASFGAGGRVVVDMGGGSLVEGARGVVIEADGRIVLAGVSDAAEKGFALLGLEPDGSVDAAFGNSGRAFPALGIEAECQAVVLQNDGKIVASGILGPSATMIAIRVLPNGAVDPSFGEAGIAKIFSGAGSAAAAIDGAGRILLAGSPGFVLGRLTPTGQPDQALGPGGWVQGLSDGGAQHHVSAVSLAVGADGRIVLGGSQDVVTLEEMVLLRYVEAPTPVPALSEGFFLLLLGALGAAGWLAARRFA